ncbi:MAG: hypothetical protein IJ055_03380 [Oscillospiraceae bacterium]|nr:hypothetical protein [Oscillospiraceae bacterium]
MERVKVFLGRYGHLVLGCLLTLGVILWNLRGIGMCHQPTIFQDEAGYWTHAAILTGHDWSGVSEGLVWYSYGYSLILAVLMLLFDAPAMQYQAALVLNALMLGAVLWVFWLILRQLFKKLPPALLFLPALAGVLYAPYQVYSLTTWSEITVLLVFSLITLTVLRSVESPRYGQMILLGVLCGYSFMVHNRCIGIVAAVCFTMLLAFLGKRLPWKHALCFLGVLCAMFAVHLLIKHGLTERLWENGPPAANDAGTVTGRLKTALSSVEGLKLWMSVTVSQGFAGVISGFCMPLIAYTVLTIGIVHRIAEAVGRRRRQEEAKPLLTVRFLQYVYLVCAFLAMLLISSIFMTNFDRIDHVLYTRYIDCTLGPAVAIGICLLLRNERMKHLPLLLLVLAAGMYLGVNRTDVLIAHLTDPPFNSLCTPVIADFKSEHGLEYYAYAFLGAAPAILALGLSQLLPRRKWLTAVLMTALFSWLSVYHTAAPLEQLRKNQAANDSNAKVFDTLAEVPDEAVYVKASAGSLPYQVQLHLQDKRIEMAGDIEEIPANAYFICKMEDCLSYCDYELTAYNDDILVLRNASPEVFYFPLDQMSFFDEAAFDEDAQTIINTEDSSVLCFGPYLPAQEGNYVFDLTLDILEMPPGTKHLGTAELHADGQVLDHVELTTGELNDHQVLLDAEFPYAPSQVEIVVLIDDPSKMRLKLRSIACTSGD